MVVHDGCALAAVFGVLGGIAMTVFSIRMLARRTVVADDHS